MANPVLKGIAQNVPMDVPGAAKGGLVNHLPISGGIHAQQTRAAQSASLYPWAAFFSGGRKQKKKRGFRTRKNTRPPFSKKKARWIFPRRYGRPSLGRLSSVIMVFDTPRPLPPIGISRARSLLPCSRALEALALAVCCCRRLPSPHHPPPRMETENCGLWFLCVVC